MTTPRITALVDEGLGNSTYLLDLGDGRALAVDPSRDLRTVRRRAENAGLKIAYVAETHLHADFVSGARQLAAIDGAEILASAAGDRAFDHVRLNDADEIDLGGLTLRALGTPGHTDEHLSYLLLDGRRELGVFTGGSLLVGSAARTDLADPARTEQLARAQYRSIRRLFALGDEVTVWPTHGAGSFCAAPVTAERTTTIGAEKATNPLMAAADEDVFVARLLAGLGGYPPYFDRLAEVNRLGPALLTADPRIPDLPVPHVKRLLADGAVLVDVRPVRSFAAGHIPGALSIPLRAQFASWLGWLLPDDAPFVIVRDPGQDLREIFWQAFKIGYERFAGEPAGGISAWPGEPATTPLVSASDIDEGRVLDVRQESEYAIGHLRGAVHIELGDLASRIGDLPDGPVTVMCGHGERAMTAASILERASRTGVTVLDGGPDDVARATEISLESDR